jgi:uncharacterized protein
MSLKSTVENYKRAKLLYKEIDDVYYDLQQGAIEETEFILNQTINKFSEFKKYLKGIHLEDLKDKYPEKTQEAVKSNVEIFNDALYFLERFFLGAKYALGLREPIMVKYVPGLNLEQHELDKWGGEKQLSRKLIAALTHPDNVLEYDKSIRRMILGTMLQKEFGRIYDIIKHKMIKPAKKSKLKENKIPTLEEYMKIINEDFFNPFDITDKEKKPGKISDKGGPLTVRKETFNLARVEFSKRPGGEFIILAKTQFAKGEIVEICPVILLKEEAKTIDNLKDIIFEIDREKNEWALVLGYGSMYRHSEQANVEYAYNRLTKQMYFITKKPVKLAEELTINYGQDYWMERMNFNKVTDDEVRTDQNQGMPTSGKAITKNESEVQPNSADMENKSNVKAMSSPNNPRNPVISGVAIIGTGQQ